MNASDYLKTRTDLLIAVESLRRAPLAEFLSETERLNDNPLVDHDGLEVPNEASRMVALARHALALVACGPLARPVVSERGEDARGRKVG